jgi:hypothetical protein
MITGLGQSVAILEGCRDGDGATGGMVVSRTRQPLRRGPLEMRGRRLERALLTTLQGWCWGAPRFSLPLMQQPRISGASRVMRTLMPIQR